VHEPGGVELRVVESAAHIKKMIEEPLGLLSSGNNPEELLLGL
jgi:hypothetical protein